MVSERRAWCVQKMNIGVDHLDAGALQQAVSILLDAASIDSQYFGPWFNLGLAYKRLRKWEEALDAFLRARSRLPTDVSTEVYASVLWNSGIAASILRVWPYARQAWQALGYSLDPLSEAPPDLALGNAWVALSKPTDAVLGERIDPARIRLCEDAAQGSRMLPTGTVVVHDAERVSSKEYRGVSLPVFPLLHVQQDDAPGSFEQYRAARIEQA